VQVASGAGVLSRRVMGAAWLFAGAKWVRCRQWEGCLGVDEPILPVIGQIECDLGGKGEYWLHCNFQEAGAAWIVAGQDACLGHPVSRERHLLVWLLGSATPSGRGESLVLESRLGHVSQGAK